MLKGAGITSLNTQLLLQGLQNVCQFIGAITGAIITHRVGGPDGEPVAESAITARAQIAMLFIFGFAYSAGWTPNQAMYPVECLRYESRAKGMGMYNVSVVPVSVPWVFLMCLVLRQRRRLL